NYYYEYKCMFSNVSPKPLENSGASKTPPPSLKSCESDPGLGGYRDHYMGDESIEPQRAVTYSTPTPSTLPKPE
ncbi:hypothetical protein L9F63_014093, partial [Diploptera punctata]